MTRQYQVHDALIDTPAALVHDPVTVNRLRGLRAGRQRVRQAREAGRLDVPGVSAAPPSRPGQRRMTVVLRVARLPDVDHLAALDCCRDVRLSANFVELENGCDEQPVQGRKEQRCVPPERAEVDGERHNRRPAKPSQSTAEAQTVVGWVVAVRPVDGLTAPYAQQPPESESSSPSRVPSPSESESSPSRRLRSVNGTPVPLTASERCRKVWGGRCSGSGGTEGSRREGVRDA